MTKTPPKPKTTKPRTAEPRDPPPQTDRMADRPKDDPALNPSPAPASPGTCGGVTRSILRLEEAQDWLMEQFRKARTLEQKMKLANALASNCRALFQGYRMLMIMEGGAAPMEKAYNELKVLEFDED
jgi:hypothetical protein